MSWIATAMMKKEMEKIDIPRVSEFIEMIHDAGCKIYACKATVDLFKLTKQELLPPGRQDSDGRGILRRVGWSPDHFHVSHLTSN